MNWIWCLFNFLVVNSFVQFCLRNLYHLMLKCDNLVLPGILMIDLIGFGSHQEIMILQYQKTEIYLFLVSGTFLL